MTPDAGGFQEMIRFNEAIDQLLTESIRQHAQRTKRMGDLFAGALAHDVRSPLTAIWNSAEVLLRDDSLLSNGMRTAANVQRSSARMKRMIDDLLVFARTRLGDALPLELTSQDIGRVCRNAAAEVCAAFPDTHIDVRLSGRLTGISDGERICEMLVDVLTNAIEHGAGDIKL